MNTRHGWPPITPEQRELAVALMANALRVEGRRRRPAEPWPPPPGPAAARQAGASPEHRYLQGMRDLLAVLFAGGRLTADECYEAARRLEASEG